MPVRNGERFVARAVRSTLRALPSDSQLKVLDDASDDRTPEILQGFRDKRLQIERSETNLGVAKALNQLMTNSDSRYVARMDADDVCLPWRFRQQLDSHRTGELLFSRAIVMSERGIPLRPQWPGASPPSALRVLILFRNMLMHDTLFAERATIQRLGGYRALPCEDYDMWLRAIAHNIPIRLQSRPTILLRLHPASTSQTRSWRTSLRAHVGRGDALQSAHSAAVESVLGVESPPATLRHALGLTSTHCPDSDDLYRRACETLSKEVDDRLVRYTNLRRLKRIEDARIACSAR